jgi:hypothetical protein
MFIIAMFVSIVCCACTCHPLLLLLAAMLAQLKRFALLLLLLLLLSCMQTASAGSLPCAADVCFYRLVSAGEAVAVC